MMGYMGDECLDDGERDEAEQWYRRGVEHMPIEIGDGDQRSAVTYTRLLTILTEKEGCVWEDAEEIYQKAVKHLPKEADFDYIAGRYFAASGQASRAVMRQERGKNALLMRWLICSMMNMPCQFYRAFLWCCFLKIAMDWFPMRRQRKGLDLILLQKKRISGYWNFLQVFMIVHP